MAHRTPGSRTSAGHADSYCMESPVELAAKEEMSTV